MEPYRRYSIKIVIKQSSIPTVTKGIHEAFLHGAFVLIGPYSPITTNAPFIEQHIISHGVICVDLTNVYLFNPGVSDLDVLSQYELTYSFFQNAKYNLTICN